MSIKTIISKLMPMRAYLKVEFRYRMGYWPDLKNPKTFNEKQQILKLRYEREKPAMYSAMADKIESKKYVADILGPEHIIPTLGVFDNFGDIDFNDLPDQFVIKCNHDSGGLVVCPDKSRLDIVKSKNKIDRCMKQNYYWHGREWPYKPIAPKVMVEQYMADESGTELKDYKFFCFNGKVRCFKVDFNRFADHRANYFDTDMSLLPFGEVVCPPNFNEKIILPDNINEMMVKAEMLSQGIPFIRVDFYSINGKVYFGELTFFPASGFGRFTDEKWDRQLGDWLELT